VVKRKRGKKLMRKKLNGTLILMTLCLIAVQSLGVQPVMSGGDGSASSDSGIPALYSALSPWNASINGNITWLLWTYPIVPNGTVVLKIYDYTNDTTVYGPTETTLSPAGAMNLTIATDGFNSSHTYSFIAALRHDYGWVQSEVELAPPITPSLNVYCYASPYEVLLGEPVSIQIWLWPAGSASANLTVIDSNGYRVYNETGIQIPENGSATVEVSTENLTAGYYEVNVTVTRDGLTKSDTCWFSLTYVILQMEEYTYYLGENITVTVYSLPAINQATIEVEHWDTGKIMYQKVVNLTDGQATVVIETNSSWPTGSYWAKGSVTVDSTVYTDYRFFELTEYSVSAFLDRYLYFRGLQNATLTIRTYPAQPNASFQVQLMRWSDGYESIWNTTSQLTPYGNASIIIPLTELNLTEDYYDIKVTVNSSGVVKYAWEFFYLEKKTFDVVASVDAYNLVGYSMPILTVTTSPGQTQANATIHVSGFNFYYKCNLTNTDITEVTIPLPFAALKNDSYSIGVFVDSSAGSNKSWTWVQYSSGLDTDMDGLSDADEEAIGTDPTSYDSDGDGYFDGLEVFTGSDPLNSESTPVSAPVEPVVSGTIMNPDLINETSPFVLNATEEVNTELKITNVSAPCTISIKNVTSVPEEIKPATYLKVVGRILEISSSRPVSLRGVIRVYYDPAELNASGIVPETLKIYRWNATVGEWQPLPSIVNTTAHYVEANITHLSYWALIGRTPPTAVTLNAPAEADITYNSIVLTWTENQDPDFEKYEIYMSTTEGELGTLVTTITDSSTTTYTVTDLTPGTTYYFTVRVVNTAGLYADSNTVSATTKELPMHMQPWFMAAVAIGIIAIIVVVIVVLRRR